MSANTKQLENAIEEVLKPMGFKKKANTWYFSGTDCICLVDLQKSNFGGQYYINLAVAAKQLETNPFPKEHKCHVRGRLSEIVSDKKQLEYDLNFEDESSSDDKIARIVKAIHEEAIPLLLGCQDLKSLKTQFELGNLKTFLVSLKMKNLLGVASV